MRRVNEELLEALSENGFDSSDIEFADIYFNAYYMDEPKQAILIYPDSTNDEINAEIMKGECYYDSGYGSQHLFGIVKLKNGCWFERGEYDGMEYGMEWWEMKKPPVFENSKREFVKIEDGDAILYEESEEDEW